MNVENMLKALVRDGNRFRWTPIVDDDFTAMRNQFDTTLDNATEFLKQYRPKIVCLCGSTRFFEAFREANLRLTLAGIIVLSVGCDTKSDEGLKLTTQDKLALDALHLCKIDMADEVLILNVGGYIGESTKRELKYAQLKGKVVRFLESI